MCLSTRFLQPHHRLSTQVKPSSTVSLLLILAIPCILQILAIAIITFLCLHYSQINIGLTAYPEQIQATEPGSTQLHYHWFAKASIHLLKSKVTSSELTGSLLEIPAYAAVSDHLPASQIPEQFINIAIPVAAIVNQLTQSNLMIAGLCFPWVMMTVGTIVYLSRKLARPILQLSQVSQQLAQGKLVPTITLGRIRELAILADSFNYMCTEIRQVRQLLELHSQMLEQKVSERTQALEQEVRKRVAIEAVLHQANRELEQLAFFDGLTDLLNRRHFDNRLNQEWRRLRHTGKPLSVILCDIDYFKQFNDTYGHLAGDECLRQVSRTLQQIGLQQVGKRSSDVVVARYGGEEFALLLPDTTPTGAIQIAYEIQSAIRSLQITHQGSPIYPFVTVSLGIASLVPHGKDSPQQLIASADRALYQAKSKGRDCIVVSNSVKVGEHQFV